MLGGTTLHSSLFSLPGLVHGITARDWGDMRRPQNRAAVVSRVGLNIYPLVWLTQKHGKSVITIDGEAPEGKDLPYDGAVTMKQGVVLAVHVGDCVPLLFADPVSKIIGVAHAGWRGTLTRISGVLVDTMKSLGSHTSDIHVYLGPHIGMCCYTVPEERAQQFRKQFGQRDDVALPENGDWHVDTGKANVLTLMDCGIDPRHVDAPITCTSCQVNRFFSYRKDPPDTFGEIMGFIAYEKDNKYKPYTHRGRAVVFCRYQRSCHDCPCPLWQGMREGRLRKRCDRGVPDSGRARESQHQDI